jgi:hypothetical protein
LLFYSYILLGTTAKSGKGKFKGKKYDVSEFIGMPTQVADDWAKIMEGNHDSLAILEAQVLLFNHFTFTVVLQDKAKILAARQKLPTMSSQYARPDGERQQNSYGQVQQVPVEPAPVHDDRICFIISYMQVDIETIPAQAPFKCTLLNLPFQLTENELRDILKSHRINVGYCLLNNYSIQF